MSSATLPEEFGRVIADDEPFEPSWLADHLIGAEGLTAITGASKVGKTTLAIECIEALRSPKAHQGNILGAWIDQPVKRVVVIATHGQHAQYQRAFAHVADVTIIEVKSKPSPGFWPAYANYAKQAGADLVVIDTVQS